MKRDLRFESPGLNEVRERADAEQGQLHLARVLTDAGRAVPRDGCRVTSRAEKGEFDPDKTWPRNALPNVIHHRSPATRELTHRGPLVDVAERLIGPNINGVTSQLTFKPRGNAKAFGWHQHNGYGELDSYNAFTTRTPRDDTDEQNGCLWRVPASHQRGQIEPGLSVVDARSERSLEMAFDERQAIPVPMRAGEAIAFHCGTSHKPAGNHSPDRHRRLLSLRNADADAAEVDNDRRPRLGPSPPGVTISRKRNGLEPTSFERTKHERPLGSDCGSAGSPRRGLRHGCPARHERSA